MAPPAPPPHVENKKPPGPAPQRAADAHHGRTFDPWHSVGAGHQRAESSGVRGWRGSRNAKLRGQFAAGHSGGERVSDAVGAGSEDFDERRGVVVPRHVRARAANSVADMLRRQATGSNSSSSSSRSGTSSSSSTAGSSLGEAQAAGAGGTTEGACGAEDPAASQRRKIFDGLVVYVNGSTHPAVSDHRLKHVLTENGARMSLHLCRRQVTHVILGRPASSGGGAGGGLAGGKLEKEIRRVGGCGVKYVDVEWYGRSSS